MTYSGPPVHAPYGCFSGYSHWELAKPRMNNPDDPLCVPAPASGREYTPLEYLAVMRMMLARSNGFAPYLQAHIAEFLNDHPELQ